MALEKEDFTISAPPHLSPIDWNISEHQRLVAACLVQGVYLLELDKQKHREGTKALAPTWWESFHFKLTDKLVDEADSSIFGAIFESNSSAASQNNLGTPPKFVIAFRGTLLKKKSFLRDSELNLHIFKNCLHRKSRCKDALKYAQELVANVGQENVWIVGHSLGAALALYVGKKLAKKGSNVMTLLFNPPFITLPIERLIKHKRFKEVLHNVHDIVNVVAVTVRGEHQPSEKLKKVSSWVPHVFVNPKDDICNTYIGYFEHRKELEKKGLGHLWRLTTHNSLRDMFLQACNVDSKSLHILPSANLIVNHAHAKDFRHAHAISQWWHPKPALREQLYLY